MVAAGSRVIVEPLPPLLQMQVRMKDWRQAKGKLRESGHWRTAARPVRLGRVPEFYQARTGLVTLGLR